MKASPVRVSKKLSRGTESLPLLNTKFGWHKVEPYRLPKPWPKDDDSLLRELRRFPLDSQEVVSNTIERTGEKQYRHVKVLCSICKKKRAVSVDNILSGKSRHCRCQQTKYRGPRESHLQQRYSAMRQRCMNPNNRNWGNYGGRGIECRFNSAEHFIKWIIKNLPHPTYKKIDIGRINNEGHYEPGNLRLESRQSNTNNTRRNVWVNYKGQKVTITQLFYKLKEDYRDFNLCIERTRILASSGVPWQEILLRVPRKKRRSTTS